MEENKKTWIETIQEGWRKTPNSVKFWNGLVLVGLIVTGVLSLEILSVVLAIMSVAALALFLDAMGHSDDYLDKHIWLYFTPLAWGLFILALIIIGIGKLYEETIVKFNNWLNK
jgi:hypothetical protein